MQWYRSVVTGAIASRATALPYRVLTCLTIGERVTNGNDRTLLDDDNDLLYESERWYGVRLAERDHRAAVRGVDPPGRPRRRGAAAVLTGAATGTGRDEGDR